MRSQVKALENQCCWWIGEAPVARYCIANGELLSDLDKTQHRFRKNGGNVHVCLLYLSLSKIRPKKNILLELSTTLSVWQLTFRNCIDVALIAKKQKHKEWYMNIFYTSGLTVLFQLLNSLYWWQSWNDNCMQLYNDTKVVLMESFNYNKSVCNLGQ